MEVKFVEFRSPTLTYIFVAYNKRQLSPTATDFDAFELDEAVINLTREVNQAGERKDGKTISDDGVAQDLKRIHFCSLFVQPWCPF